MEVKGSNNTKISARILYPGFGNIWLIVSVGAIIYTYYFQNAQAAFYGSPVDSFEISPQLLIESSVVALVGALLLILPTLVIGFFEDSKIVTLFMSVIDKLIFKGGISSISKQLKQMENQAERGLRRKKDLQHNLNEIVRVKEELERRGERDGSTHDRVERIFEEIASMELEIAETSSERDRLSEQAKSLLRLIRLKVSFVVSLLYWVVLMYSLRPTSVMYISNESGRFHWILVFIILFLYISYVMKRPHHGSDIRREIQKGNVLFIVGLMGAAIYLAPWFGTWKAFRAEPITVIVDGSAKKGVFVGKTFFNLSDNVVITSNNLSIELSRDSSYRKMHK